MAKEDDKTLALSKSERQIYAKEMTSTKINADAWNMFLMRSNIDSEIKSLVNDAYSYGFNFVLTCAKDCLPREQYDKLIRHIVKMQNKLNHDNEI
ncbi:MAG: hypothetical protein K2H46_03855 [Muribaculaceae bacterium]|nr:hypothetical protein [Muribaculaceae bacterium]